MKASIHHNDVSDQSRIGKIVGDQMYVKASGKNLPSDFIIYADSRNGPKHGVKPVESYSHAKEIVKALEDAQTD